MVRQLVTACVVAAIALAWIAAWVANPRDVANPGFEWEVVHSDTVNGRRVTFAVRRSADPYADECWIFYGEAMQRDPSLSTCLTQAEHHARRAEWEAQRESMKRVAPPPAIRVPTGEVTDPVPNPVRREPGT